MTVRRSETPFRRASRHRHATHLSAEDIPLRRGFAEAFPRSPPTILLFILFHDLWLSISPDPIFLPYLTCLYIVTLLFSTNIWQSYSLMLLFFDDISTGLSWMDMAYRTDYRIEFNLLFSTISLIFVQRKSFDFSLLLFLFFPVNVQPKTSM